MLVTCIMPTADRRRFVPAAIEYFLRQDYPERELLIVDDGADAVEDLVPADPRVRYLRIEPGLTLGAKRNRACEEARGEIFAHWDDDDWHAPRRLYIQVQALLASGAELCGIDRLLFYAPATGRAWEYTYPAGRRPWLSGSTLMYRRGFWERHRFANVNVGEDSRFVWAGPPRAMHVLADHTFHVGIIHDRNTSPKRTRGPWWREIPADTVRALLGADADLYAMLPASAPAAPAAPVVTAASRSAAPPLRNLFACLVHEQEECVLDLVRNLRHLDPSSAILLYNGSADPALLSRAVVRTFPEVLVHPDPRPMKWGTLHGFALDCMRFARRSLEFDTLTMVDSDQLGVRAGYSAHLARFLAGQEKVGLLGNSPTVQRRGTRIPPATTAWQEFELWRPFLRRFPDGESKWVHWSFWPSTVFTSDACEALLDLFDHDEQLRRILGASKLWATEEILFPTLSALLGYRVLANPCSYDYVKYRATYSAAQLDAALRRADVYWVHPVPRRYDDPLRRRVRDRFHHYDDRGGAMQLATPEPRLFLTLPVLSRMKGIEGWLEEDEADLLIAATRAACSGAGGDPPGQIVEIGSYCGRSTVVLASAARAFASGVRVYAVDPHDGTVGAADQGVHAGESTLRRFLHNLADAGVTDTVEVVQKFSWQVEWDRPIALLFIDGLHDYANVARDFAHFEPWLAPGAYVAFHDYADYYPGVKAFVHELLARGGYTAVQLVRSTVLLQRSRA
jgi:hypothetical protein